ncbi:MAG TPA: hypothetical protein VED17_08715 [Nitrososphaerales archaeon]|nr:hypothetical protein [Nitrososphaerales archaeon]
MNSDSAQCNPELKVGDTCDACWMGIMLPPGGIQYYEEELKKYGPLRSPKAQQKIVCPRCGHWHTSLGMDYKAGF